MVLETYRQAADAILEPMARALTGVSPNTLSALAFLAAALAGAAFYIGGGLFLALAFVLVLGNALLDALDGKLAKLTGKASARGDFLDHVLDRYADVLMLTGITFSPYCPEWLGLFAILGVLLTSYMGTQAQAVGLGRLYGGALGRADRLVILGVVTVLQFAIDPTGVAPLGIEPLRFSYLGWAMVLFAVLGNVTAVQRAVSSWRRLT